MRLKKDRLPVIDVAMDFPTSERFANELLEELARGPAQRKTMQ